MLIGHFVENAARHEPERVAVQFGTHRLTYGALRDRSALLAEALERTGPAPRVALLADNRPEANELHIGVPMAGGTLTFINQRLGTEEITYILEHSETTVLVVGHNHAHHVPALRAAVPGLRTVVGIGVEVGTDTDHPDVDLGYEALLATATGEGPRAAVAPQDTAWIVYTSGTTGRPKGVMVSHRNLTASVTNLVLGVGHERHMRQAQPFPQSHITSYSELGCYAVAGTYHLMASFDPAEYLHMIERERITATSMAPAMLGILLAREDLADVDVSSVRRISYGASGISPTLLRRAMARFANAGFYQGFGMTELAGNAAWLDEETHRLGVADRPELLTRAGRAAPFAGIRIVDEQGADLPTGVAGEIAVRGDQVMEGYWRNPEATRAAIPDGWLRTGDVGTLDADGLLSVVDRKKDMIVTGGENVYSLEVENVLAAHPGVADAAIIGLPDEVWGENICAVVVVAEGAEPTPEELIAHVRAHLASYKKPKVVRFVDALPRNPSGKVLKRELRERFAPVP